MSRREVDMKPPASRLHGRRERRAGQRTGCGADGWSSEVSLGCQSFGVWRETLNDRLKRL